METRRASGRGSTGRPLEAVWQLQSDSGTAVAIFVLMCMFTTSLTPRLPSPPAFALLSCSLQTVLCLLPVMTWFQAALTAADVAGGEGEGGGASGIPHSLYQSRGCFCMVARKRLFLIQFNLIDWAQSGITSQTISSRAYLHTQNLTQTKH